MCPLWGRTRERSGYIRLAISSILTGVTFTTNELRLWIYYSSSEISGELELHKILSETDLSLVYITLQDDGSIQFGSIAKSHIRMGTLNHTECDHQNHNDKAIFVSHSATYSCWHPNVWSLHNIHTLLSQDDDHVTGDQVHPDQHISTLQTEDKIGITILKKPKNIEIIIIIIKHNIVYHIYILRSLLIISSSLVSNKNDKKHKTSSLNRGVSSNTWDMWDLGAEPQYITR